MPAQIAVRLPDDIVSFIDSEIESKRAPSRAAVVLRALQREQRRRAAERDAEILASERMTEFDDLATRSSDVSLDVD